jgi:hypothetical protein
MTTRPKVGSTRWYRDQNFTLYPGELASGVVWYDPVTGEESVVFRVSKSPGIAAAWRRLRYRWTVWWGWEEPSPETSERSIARLQELMGWCAWALVALDWLFLAALIGILIWVVAHR